MTLPQHHRRPSPAACQTLPTQPRGGDQQGVNQPSRRPLSGLRPRVIENPGMGDRIQRNTQPDRGVASDHAVRSARSCRRPRSRARPAAARPGQHQRHDECSQHGQSRQQHLLARASPRRRPGAEEQHKPEHECEAGGGCERLPRTPLVNGLPGVLQQLVALSFAARHWLYGQARRASDSDDDLAPRLSAV